MGNRPYSTYPGGKNGSGVFQAIINQIPPHDVFFSAFAGNCGVLANKLPAPIANIAVDADAAVTQKWSLLPGVTTINDDVIKLLPDLIADFADSGHSVFVFLDPPYLAESRKADRALYKYEMRDLYSHEKLLRSVTQINERWPAVRMMLTHYPCQFYDDALSCWRRMDIRGQSRQGSTIERLYMNYDQPSQLHDVRYHGSNFRHRELLKKSAKNLKRKFQKWSPLDKQYFLFHLNESGIK